MSEVVVESFPLIISSCIIQEFAATHIESEMFSSFDFPFAARMTIFGPLVCPISCSSSLESYVPRLTKSGINKGFSPCLVAALFWGPKNT